MSNGSDKDGIFSERYVPTLLAQHREEPTPKHAHTHAHAHIHTRLRRGAGICYKGRTQSSHDKIIMTILLLEEAVKGGNMERKRKAGLGQKENATLKHSFKYHLLRFIHLPGRVQHIEPDPCIP